MNLFEGNKSMRKNDSSDFLIMNTNEPIVDRAESND